VPNVASWIVDKHTGTLTANPGVQLPVGPRKMAAFSTYLYVIADPNANAATMWVFKIDPLNGALSLLSDHTTQLPGVPFGMAIDPSGSFVFILWDGVPGGKVSALSRDATTGKVTVLQSASDTGGLAPGAIAVTPDGKFVVIVNQRSNNLSVFSLDANTGALAPVPGSPFPSGSQPGPMAIDPSGKFVLVADSGNNNLTPYTIDSAGSLTAGTPAFLGEANSQPGTIAVDPAGKFVFVGIFNQKVAGITLDPNTGSLKPMPGSPFSASPSFVTTDMVFVPGETH
jgi:6-phosphogluconolactonase